jgi:prepilin-type N-terminal cleavage/methylation domain-containing protein
VKIAKAKGFSLIELMIVIVIIVIVATIASFSWQRSVNNTNLRAAARDLVSDINSMQVKAASKTDTPYTIDFNKTANTYTMNGTTVVTKSLTSFGPGIVINTLPLGGAAYTLNFLSRGTLTLSTTTNTSDTITLKNNRGSSANIIFYITGKPYVTFTMQ